MKIKYKNNLHIFIIILFCVYCLLPTRFDIDNTYGYLLLIPIIHSMITLVLKPKIGNKYNIIFIFIGLITILPMSSTLESTQFFRKALFVIIGGIVYLIVNEFVD